MTQLKKERKRRIKIRVVPHDGYSIDAELEKDTSIEEVLSTLEELGFKYPSDGKPLSNKPGEDLGRIIVENIFSEFQSITQDYGVSIKTSEKFYDNWLKLGFKIVDLKHAFEGNTPLRGDSKNSVTVPAAEEELRISSHNLDALSSPLPSGEKQSPESPVHNTLGDESEPGSQIRSPPDPSEPTATEGLSLKEGKPEIRPIFEVETADKCKFCSIFRDMGNVVCPNCGRALNLKHDTEKPS